MASTKQVELDRTVGFIEVRGAREHNLKNIDVTIPRDALVVFTGVSGSGKSSLAFGTLYAEAQRRYLESVSPYARRLFQQMQVPEVGSITGLPPAIALQQQRGAPTTRSSVGSVTTLSNLLRMLYSRAGDYPAGLPLLYAESFSANTPQGACPNCHGLGRVYTVTEQSMVPDDSLSIRQKAIAAWPSAWGGQNLREILMTLGYNVDKPWRDLPKKDRDWILFTEEQPTVPVYSGFNPAEIRAALKRKEKPSYMGTFTGARKHVLQTFATSQSAMMKKRALQFMTGADCPACKGKRLQPDSLRVKFAGLDIAELSALPMKQLDALLRSSAANTSSARHIADHPEQVEVRKRIVQDLLARLEVLLDLGLGYLSTERSTPTLSPGELQRLRLATQVYSNLFGVVYVLDEPSAGLHPADTQALLAALERLKASGNSLFVVEHETEVMQRADWIIDIGPGAGEKGGEVLYSGPAEGLRNVKASQTAAYLFGGHQSIARTNRPITEWLTLKGITRNNLNHVEAAFPIGVLTAVTGISGSGKSSLVSQALVELLQQHLGHAIEAEEKELLDDAPQPTNGKIVSGINLVSRLVQVDQKAIGRTPRSNLATYTGLFDEVRKLFAAAPLAKRRKYSAGRFSFNVNGGRCEHCRGEGFVMVELLFLPSVYSPCPVCHGKRYNEKTLEVLYHDKNIAEVLEMTVDTATAFFEKETNVCRALKMVSETGLGYLRLGQSATELSGGEAQRVKLATELLRPPKGGTMYILDEPTTGLHPADVDKLLGQLQELTDKGNTVIVVEHDMQVIANCDWVIDMGPGAGDEGGKIIASGTPIQIAETTDSKTGNWLKKYLER